jgi:hypothetical protein
MNHTTKETESGAIREIEPEIRTLFSKVVERDPREAAKMLEPYPDEFVVGMLELLNPIAALNILERFDPPLARWCHWPSRNSGPIQLRRQVSS